MCKFLSGIRSEQGSVIKHTINYHLEAHGNDNNLAGATIRNFSLLVWYKGLGDLEALHILRIPIRDVKGRFSLNQPPLKACCEYALRPGLVVESHSSHVGWPGVLI
jgi:hypothetical protein